MRDSKRADRRKYHFIYKTTCLVTGRWYVGMHSTDDLQDGYLGSGTVLSRSVKKYGKDAHQLEILEYCHSRKNLALREAEIVNDALLREPLCMNIQRGGRGGTPGFLVDKPTRQKISELGKQRWSRDRASLKQKLDEELAAFSMSREEVLAALVQPDGKLNKNATRALTKLQTDRLAGQEDRKILARRERLVATKWAFILDEIENPVFGPDLVQQIDAFVFNRRTRPTCKICNTPTTFFRFGQPYATYCGAKCQLTDPQFRNPVLKRYQH